MALGTPLMMIPEGQNRFQTFIGAEIGISESRVESWRNISTVHILKGCFNIETIRGSDLFLYLEGKMFNFAVVIDALSRICAIKCLKVVGKIIDSPEKGPFLSPGARAQVARARKKA